MTHDLEKLERDVERELARLPALREIQPSPQCVAAVQAAVRAEAARAAAPRRRVVWAIRASIGVAAALLLAIGWSLVSPPAPRVVPQPVASSSEELLDDWAAAIDLSRDRVTMLLDYGWLDNDPDVSSETGFRDLLDSLDESLPLGA